VVDPSPARVIETIDHHSGTTFKGLQDIHYYTCERLEGLIFDRRVAAKQGTAAAYLYGESFVAFLLTSAGQAMAMSTLTSGGIGLVLENL
jgi:hypothetical protein